MFEQDYIMRLINEVIRTILRLVFNIRTDTPEEDLLKSDEEKEKLSELTLLVQQGDINEAENLVYEITEKGDERSLKTALLFYSYLNEQSDDFLEEHAFSRDEVKSGLMDLLERYGLEGMAEAFLYK